jgi:hypothetical protein
MKTFLLCITGWTCLVLLTVLFSCNPYPKPLPPFQNIYVQKIELNADSEYAGKYKYTVVVHLQSVHVPDGDNTSSEKGFYYYSSDLFSAGDSLFLRCNH